MNTKNNQRYKTNSDKIKNTFLTLLKTTDYDNINVSQICKVANINRATFYAHYNDINDLIIKIESQFSNGMLNIFQNGIRYDNQSFVDMFNFIKENKTFYKAFLKIKYTTHAEKEAVKTMLRNLKSSINDFGFKNEKDLIYHMSFFGAGIKAISQIWLDNDCMETPEYMANILITEYVNKKY